MMVQVNNSHYKKTFLSEQTEKIKSLEITLPCLNILVYFSKYCALQIYYLLSSKAYDCFLYIIPRIQISYIFITSSKNTVYKSILNDSRKKMLNCNT